MDRDWEQTFRSWSKPSSDTEQTRCENAERMIRDAIAESPGLSWRNIEVFAQGSYKNNTNVRVESDVDVCVCCSDAFFYDFSLADGFTREDVGFPSGTYPYAQFRNEVEDALVAKFGRRGVTRGNKAFEVHENSYRVYADVVSCFEHRRYTSRSSDAQYLYVVPTGTELWSDKGEGIINWPRQHYENGVAKNEATGNRFKYVTRALKRLRNEMAEEGVTEAEPIPSYLIECLVWNVPRQGFGHELYWDDLRFALAHTFNETRSISTCREWGEVNELKYLFWSGQPWTCEQANEFLDAAWDYVGFE